MNTLASCHLCEKCASVNEEIPVATINTEFEINSLEIDELFKLLNS